MVDKKLVEKLVGLGGNRWTKGGMDRVYFADATLGLNCTLYNSGNIRWAEIDWWEEVAGVDPDQLNWFGEGKISNSKASKLIGAKNFINLKTGEVYSSARWEQANNFFCARMTCLLRKAELELEQAATEQAETATEQAETATSGILISLDRLDDQAFNNLAQLTKTYEHLLCKATGFSGLKLTSGKLVFLGMNSDDDAHKMLVDFIVKFATSAKQVRAEKTLLPNNEKFAFRTWLIRLGWKGRETTKLRTSLYKGLTGNSAFCTEASKLRWLEKHGTKKD